MSRGCVTAYCSPPPPLSVPFNLKIWAWPELKNGKGGPKLGWFKTLKNSARNCTLKLSEIFGTAKFLYAERSRLKSPGPTMLFRPALPRRFAQLPATLEKGMHCDAIAEVAMGTLKALVLMYCRPDVLFQLWLMGSIPGTRSGMPNVAEQFICTPIGSTAMI